MFCSQCGKKIPDGSKFCPKCGAKLDVIPASVPSPSPVKSASAIGAIGAIGGHGDIIRIAIVVASLLLGFTPLVQLNIASFFSGSYSMIDLAGIVFKLSDYASQYSSLSSTYSYAMTFLIIAETPWVCAVGISIYWIINVLRGDKNMNKSSAPCIAYAVFGIVAFALIMFIQSQIDSSTSSYIGSYSSALAQMISATSWLWLLTLLAIGGIFVFKWLDKEDKSSQNLPSQSK